MLVAEIRVDDFRARRIFHDAVFAAARHALHEVVLTGSYDCSEVEVTVGSEVLVGPVRKRVRVEVHLLREARWAGFAFVFIRPL